MIQSCNFDTHVRNYQPSAVTGRTPSPRKKKERKKSFQSIPDYNKGHIATILWYLHWHTYAISFHPCPLPSPPSFIQKSLTHFKFNWSYLFMVIVVDLTNQTSGRLRWDDVDGLICHSFRATVDLLTQSIGQLYSILFHVNTCRI